MVVKTCMACRHHVEPFLLYEKLPLGNAFLVRQDAPEERFDLALGVCPACLLVQQTCPPPRSALEADYRGYRYVPVGDSLRQHLVDLGQEAARLAHFGLVADIGSNDGTLLSGAAQAGSPVIGVEPAESISEAARQAGIPTVTGFFDHDTAVEIVARHGRARVVTCVQTLQHVPDLAAFMAAVRVLLAPDGILVVEGRYFLAAMETSGYDSIYHEMLSYGSLASLVHLLRHLGDMEVFDAVRTPTHGGSLRVYASPERRPPDLALSVLSFAEDEAGLASVGTYRRFGEESLRLADRLHVLVTQLVRSGARIIGYGAPSTSATLLNLARLDRRHVLAIADDSPLKQGRFHPGTRIPVVSSEEAFRLAPTHIFILTRQFEREIMARVQDRKLPIILPVPPRVVGNGHGPLLAADPVV